MIYVILLLGLLSILGVGFMTLGEAGLKSVAADHACSKARARAVSIHRALCENRRPDG